jgi:hypothetical protein
MSKIIQLNDLVEYRNSNNETHNENGPAQIYKNGTKKWFKNNLLHRIDGPAIEWSNGDKSWYLNGKLHRKGGPAMEYKNGNKRWYFKGIEYTFEDFCELIKSKY